MSESFPEVIVSISRFGPRLCNYCFSFFGAMEAHITEPGFYNRKSRRYIKYADVHWDRSSLEAYGHRVYPYMIEINLYIPNSRRAKSCLSIITGNKESYFVHPDASQGESIGKELAAYLNKHYTPPESTDALPAWELCRLWLDNCTQNHDKCKSLDTSFSPTRLLYIGNFGHGYFSEKDLESLKIGLHLKQDKGPAKSYMTLSHCWGNSEEMLKLTMADYERRIQNGFSFTELPKTFRDAIRLSLFLRTDYIWIDSLCIIQRSKHDTEGSEGFIASQKDWEQESKTMGKLYSLSKCNIAAIASKGPTEGCFYSRGSILVSPLEVILRTREATDNPSLKRYLFLQHVFWEEIVERAPLSMRAWYMQERTLAPRQIHCGREQLLWECHEGTACETFPFNLEFRHGVMKPATPSRVKPPSLSPVLPEMRNIISATAGNHQFPDCRSCRNKLLDALRIDDMSLMCQTTHTMEHLRNATRDEWIPHMRRHIYQEWNHIVEKYSRCKLTYNNDKLIAVFGLASEIQGVLGGMDEYVAGMWRSQLPYQLLWRTSRSFRDAHHIPAPDYRAGPSWSWACLNTHVHMVPPDINWESKHTILIDIIEVHEELTINDTKEYPLKLRCYLFKIRFSEDPSRKSGPFGPLGFLELGGHKAELRRPPKSASRRLWVDSSESPDLWKQGYMMPVRSKKHDLEGLVVVPCEGKSKQYCYRRIAQWNRAVFYHKKDILEHMMKPDQEKVTITLI
ncbi:hypothetical protein F4779DRAFT_592195 [Xylariaceae sp. FL0662B]|nr:hypothetical protein F4779DRAFT_592195 [Xylariaceae sp. FL0662B]